MDSNPLESPKLVLTKQFAFFTVPCLQGSVEHFLFVRSYSNDRNKDEAVADGHCQRHLLYPSLPLTMELRVNHIPNLHYPADSLNESVESRPWQAWAFGRELYHDFAANTSLRPLEGHTWQTLVPCPQKAPHVPFDWVVCICE